MKTDITRIDEEIFLKNKIAQASLFSAKHTTSVKEILSAFESGELPLQVAEEDGTKVIDDSDFEEIKRTIPWLFQIIQKPRSFIRSFEEKVPVETAKRINFKAISKLSRDSNDWYDRTILAVKPKNVVSDVSEETLDLYENRLVVALIDKITRAVIQARQQLVNQINEIGELQRKTQIDELFFYNKYSFPLLAKTIKASSIVEDDELVKKLKNRKDDITLVESKLALLRSTEFYRQLHKLRKVKSPIHKTNILTFDYAYNQAYKLWIYLEKTHQEDVIEKQINATFEELQSSYFLYCFLCILMSLIDMGFTLKSDSSIEFNGEKIIIDKPIEFFRNSDCLLVNCFDRSIKINYLYEEKKQKWDSVELYPNYIDFEGLGKSAVDEATEALLKQLTEFHSDASTKISFVSVDLRRCSENNTFKDKVYRRFFSSGENFDENEDQYFLEKCADYKTGISIVSCSDLRSNFLRIEKTINRLLLKHKILDSGQLDKCPICGKESLKKIDENSYVCTNCGHSISINYCSNCDASHNHPIAWIKYGDDKFLENKSFIEGSNGIPGLNDLPLYDHQKQIESLMGEFATTSFRLRKENTGWKLKTVCPRCGVELGVVRKKAEKEKNSWHDTRRK